jgi:DNA excision repair protein ERCC-4
MTSIAHPEAGASDQSSALRLPAEPAYERLTAIIDRREQQPLDLAPLRARRGTLTTGDYSLAGLEHIVAVERKSLADLVACCGGARARFEREVQRLLAYPARALVVESSWTQLEEGTWRGQVKPAAVIGSLLGWQTAGLPVLLCESRERAGHYVSRFLFVAARRRWREARALVGDVLELPNPLPPYGSEAASQT